MIGRTEAQELHNRRLVVTEQTRHLSSFCRGTDNILPLPVGSGT